MAPNNVQCACPGDVLNFMCTTVGGGQTIWTGTAFSSCPRAENEIILRHSRFNTAGDTGNCNNGAIVGRSVDAVNNCFTSQLNVTVSASLNNKTVQCIHSTNESELIDIVSLNVISGKIALCIKNIYNNNKCKVQLILSYDKYRTWYIYSFQSLPTTK